ncbi:MAG TPA: VOC family protein [Xanthobacteraceae bacterium]|jgi:catechol 2,3-dioxygenase-like lactoylglutathione lyase family enzyme|nr:VOC family protein [Xanthobacteraceae bacterium]
MPLKQLNHVTVRTDDLEGTRDFYSNVLGLTSGPRPPLSFPGYWLYCGEDPVVHLVPPRNGIGGGSSSDTGNFDHVAFVCEDFEGMRDRFKSLGVEFREQEVAGIRLRQLFVQDPNKIMVELNFPQG